MSPEHIRLLLVEDNAGDARLIQEVLADAKRVRFTLTRASRLSEALEKVASETFDAALLDLTLPDGRGLESFHRLHEAAPGLPIVIMTGLDGEDAGVAAVKEGAQDYLVKGEPASEALVRSIRHAIERTLTTAQLRESEANYRRLFDAVADPIVVIDPVTAELVDLNRVAERLYGYSRAEVIGKTAMILSAQPDESRAALVTLRTSDIELIPLRWHRRKDGRTFPAEIHSSAFQLGGRRLLINAIRDITAREESRAALTAERARLVEAQAVAKIGSWETDLSDMTVVWSDETHRIYETDPGSFHPTHAAFLARVHPEDRARVDEAFRSSLKSGERCAVEHRIVLPGGRIKYVEERWQIHPAPPGAPVRAVGTCQDVTERVVAHRLVEQAHARFQQMAESISQVFWMTDLDGRQMIYVSPAYEKIWGRTCESLYQRPAGWLDAIEPEDRERVKAALPRQAAGDYDESYRIRRPDGEVRWIRDRAFPITGADGRVQELTGVAQDVTDQVLAEAALRRTQTSLEKAQEVANMGSWINSLDLNEELQWSKQCRRIFGIPQDRRIFFTDLLELIHPDDREGLQAARGKALEEGSSFSHEYRIVRPDGALRWIHTRAEVVRDEVDGKVKLLGVVVDITEKKEGALLLKETESQLLQAQKMEAMGRLAGGVAHDFNNILTAILGLSEIALTTLPKDSPTREDLEEIRKSGLRAANLTQQLLAFSRRQVTSPRLIDLDVTVAGLAKMLRRIIGEHVELEIETGAGGATVKADPGQIEQLVMNLAVNARDAMPKGGVIKIAVATQEVDAASARPDLPAGRYVSLSVTDTGTGMTDEVKSHLFEPFFTTKEKGKGTGLGLSTCYGVVKQNGGAIECHSVAGHGTSFLILFPEAVARPAAEASAGRPSLPPGGETVLVVEDEESVRKLTSRILTKLGYAVLEAADGAAALAQLEKDHAGAIRLILTDMVMPKMSGWDMAQRAAVARPEVPVLFVSGYTDDTFEGICVLDDKTDILAKPFTAEDLAARVRRAIDHGR